MADGDDAQPTGPMLVVSAVTGNSYDTTPENVVDTVEQANADDQAAIDAAMAAYLAGLDTQDNRPTDAPVDPDDES